MPGASAVAEYYDQNTQPFLGLFGSGFEVAAIHRQIWAEGVRTERAAFEYLNRLVLEALPPTAAAAEAQVLDLGCGIGGTATWIAARAPGRVTGLTISAVQARLAAERAQRLGLADRCRFLQGDFLAVPDPGPFAGAWAIEAFVHAEDPARFFQEAARVLAPGGRLVICDDFAAHPQPPSPAAARTLAAFRTGWHLANLAPAPAALTAAAQAGLRLVAQHDLTRWLRPVPAWALALAEAALALPLTTKYWQSLRGSTALQRCVRAGWTRYYALIWEKP